MTSTHATTANRHVHTFPPATPRPSTCDDRGGPGGIFEVIGAPQCGLVEADGAPSHPAPAAAQHPAGPPGYYSADLERDVLALSVLSEGLDAWDALGDLTPSDFAPGPHRTIWCAMRDCASQHPLAWHFDEVDQRIDAISAELLGSGLVSAGTWERDELALLLLDFVPPAIPPERAATSLRRRTIWRGLLGAARRAFGAFAGDRGGTDVLRTVARTFIEAGHAALERLRRIECRAGGQS